VFKDRIKIRGAQWVVPHPNNQNACRIHFELSVVVTGRGAAATVAKGIENGYRDGQATIPIRAVAYVNHQRAMQGEPTITPLLSAKVPDVPVHATGGAAPSTSSLHAPLLTNPSADSSSMPPYDSAGTQVSGEAQPKRKSALGDLGGAMLRTLQQMGAPQVGSPLRSPEGNLPVAQKIESEASSMTFSCGALSPTRLDFAEALAAGSMKLDQEDAAVRLQSTSRKMKASRTLREGGGGTPAIAAGPPISSTAVFNPHMTLSPSPSSAAPAAAASLLPLSHGERGGQSPLELRLERLEARMKAMEAREDAVDDIERRVAALEGGCKCVVL